MKVRIGTAVSGNNCSYKIREEISKSCYSANIVLLGDLGAIDSDVRYLLISDESIIMYIKQNLQKEIVELLSFASEPVLVIPDTKENRALVKRELSKLTSTGFRSAYKYEGQTLNGRPHGKGRIDYGDGKKYIGDFVNGLRHGQGTLVMPNGESFVGRFEDDSITEDGVYYDENGNPRNIKVQAFGKRLWDKSWRLLASIACFGLAALSVWAIIGFLSSEKGGMVRVGGFVAPIFLGWWGIKYLVGFFSNLFNSKSH